MGSWARLDGWLRPDKPADRLMSRMNACELADRVVNARLLNMAFTGHSPHEKHPQWLLPALATFLG